MKKIWKRVLASVLAIVLCASVFVTINWKTVSAEDSSDGLKVIGASIRFINEDTKVDGIRFAVGVKADALTDETKSNYHLLVMPTALLTDGELTKGETYSYTAGEETKYAYAQDIKIDWAKATEETIDNEAYKVVRIYLNEIDANYYTTDVTARAYYQDGENAPVYSEAIERSYYSVANAALDDLKASEVADKYDNKVGNSYSPYDATQRDALLEVKYEKSGTWDYVDGLLVQQSAKKDDYLTDRVVKTGTGEYTIRTSFKTKTIAEIKAHGEIVGEANNVFGGIQFAYNKATNTYLELDYRKYTKDDTTTLVPSIRGYDGVAKQWVGSHYIGGASGFSFEENTLYDVNIIVTETFTKMDVRVMCRKSGTSDEFINAVNGSVTYGTTEYGDQIRFYAGRNLSGNTFSSKIIYSDKYNVIQDKGKTVTTTDNSITVSGSTSGTVTATALNKTVKANNDFALSVDMVWEDRSTTDYKNTGFQIGGYNNIAQGSKGNFYFSPKGFNIHGTKYELATLAESIPGLANVVEKIAAGTPVTWTIVATPSTTDAANKTLITYYVDGIKCVSQEITKSSIYAKYIMYHIPSNATFSNLTTKTPSFPVNVTAGPTGVVVDGVSDKLQISGYTANGTETYSVLLNKNAGTYASNYANFTLTMDVQFEKFDDSSYAGIAIGGYNDNNNGTKVTIKMSATKIATDKNVNVQLNETTMGAEAYATYSSNLENGIANELKILCVTPSAGAQTTIRFYVNGVYVGMGTMAANSIFSYRMAFLTNTNATFSNLTTKTESYPVNVTTKPDGVVVDEVSDKLQISGYTANGTDTYCVLLNKNAGTYANNYANFTLTMDVQFEKFNDSSYAGIAVGGWNDNNSGTKVTIKMSATQIKTDKNVNVNLNATTMGEDAYATYVSNLDNGIANELKVVCATPSASQPTTITFYVNGVKVGEGTMAANSIFSYRMAFITNTNATLSNLVIE